MVATQSVRRARSRSKIACPSAAPSVGSVPEPSSSRSTRLIGVAVEMASETRRRCDRNVLTSSIRDCSSPMSQTTWSNQGMLVPSAAGTGSPAIARSATSPAVLMATVFPPMLGPVTRRSGFSASSSRSSGTGSCGISPRAWRSTRIGWRAPRSRSERSPVSRGRDPRTACVQDATACAASSRARHSRSRDRAWRSR